jgi:membrane-associated phospholipid phosphatase
VLTVLATVYLGWHYFVDTLGGAALGAAGVWIAALGTGNHVRGRPRLVRAEAAVTAETVGADSR